MQKNTQQKYMAPISVSWSLTKLCNLRCKHCFVYEPQEVPKASSNDADLHDALRIVDNLSEAGIFSIVFLGGEPLMIKWFPDLLEYCDKKNIETTFSTNGALFTEDKTRRIAATNIKFVQVSLDGPTEKIHDAIRGSGQFNQAISALRLCKELGVVSRIAMTLMSNNVDHIYPLLELCLKENVKFLKLSTFIPTGRGAKTKFLIPNKQKFMAAIYAAKEFEKKHPDQIKIMFPCFLKHLDNTIEWTPEIKNNELSCGAGTTTAVIYEDGAISACDFVPNERFGDLRKDSFISLWNKEGTSLKKWRQTELIGGKCGSCGYQSKCGYGCRANALHSGGDFHGWDPSCIVRDDAHSSFKSIPIHATND